MVVSSAPSALLEAAQALITDQIAHLRTLHQSAHQRLTRLEAELRAAERQLDELVMQGRFLVERGQTVTPGLTQREQQVRKDYEVLSGEHATLRHTLRQLDQLIRQIEMSSATLSGNSEGEPADPWAQALRAQVIMGREEERQRLAREVHDGPAQVLANGLMGVERCQTLLASQRFAELGVVLDQLGENAREGLREVRSFIAELRPAKLDEHGLRGALLEYIRRYHEIVNASVKVDIDALPRLPAEIEIVLYRLVQEALQNARKHAPGAPIVVHLHLHQGNLLLSIRDEGPGFDPREVIRRAGRESWGLTSMRERAELIGAHFVVTTRPGHGTEVTVSLPMVK
ncbi:sensor histidine kinase [Candidatus Chloroploca sp. M-50]|uniref:Sensor histidine kinase n=1 Tax=Candidatus Chloroploca mongolica TaxID=2528176 RepID=A0ABS4DFH6_9CHLR|nr:sensor histidine kinase [Candidatus Chloroploca mongolica]MBP1468178.1 sensor histidine kinase [Candidatus Chloroploca mongolica]